MANKMILALILLGFSLVLSLSAQEATASQKPEIKDTEEMNLEDLLNTSVSTGSSTAKKISESPNVISVITEEDIRRSGYQDLYQVLTLVPGVQITETYWRPRTLVFRGVLMTNYNDKSLLLVNGIPLYESVNREYYLNSIPVAAIKRIEVIRGPASVMYGTNAFTGAINIITHDGTEESYVEGKGGTFHTYGASGRVNLSRGGFSFLGAGTCRRDDGYPFPPFPDSTGAVRGLDMEDDYDNVFLMARYKGLDIEFSDYREKFYKFGMIPNFQYGGLAWHAGYNFSAAYRKDLTDWFHLEAWMRYNYHDRENTVGVFDYPPLTPPNYLSYKGRLFQFQVKGDFRLTEHHHLSVGGSVERLMFDDVLSVYDDRERTVIDPAYLSQTVVPSITNRDVFFQLEGDVCSWLGYVGGGRYTKLDSGLDDFSPRLGAVIRARKDLSFKVLYQKSFRAPAPLELFTHMPRILNGDPSLKPETNKTFEVAADYSYQDMGTVRFNFFRAQLDNLIDRLTKGTPPTPTYSNVFSATYYGFELEGKVVYKDVLSAFANVSYAKGKNSLTDANLDSFARVLANFGVDVTLFKKLVLSPRIQYIGTRESRLVGGTAYEIDPYCLINFTAQYEITKNLKARLECVNLTDHAIFYPDYVRRQTEYIPGEMTRGFFVNLTYSFELNH